MKTRVKAVLLAAGLGTRLKPITDRTPKCLVPVGGRPLLSYWFDRLDQAGIRHVLVNTHAFADQVRAFLGEVNATGRFLVEEAYEPTLLGSAGTITANRSYAKDADLIVIVYADNLSDVDLRAILAFHKGHGDAVTLLLFRTNEPQRCGIVSVDAEQRVLSFEEKPSRPQGNLANGGVLVLDAAAYRHIADLGGFDLGYEVLPALIGRMRGWVHDGIHIDIGTLESLRRAEADLSHPDSLLRSRLGMH